MKLLLFTATLGLTAAFNASLERRTPSRRTLAALMASPMEQFERGISLLRNCYQVLEQAEQRIEVLTSVAEDGTVETEAFDAAAVQAGTAKLPLGLFSHADQIAQWQTAVPDGRVAQGWGGRIADLMQGVNLQNGVSMNISLSGSNVFQSGNEVAEYSIDSSGDGAPPSPVTARLAAQVLFRTSSVGSSDMGPVLPAKGYMSSKVSARTWPASMASCLRTSGTCSLRKSGVMTPVFSSSMREISWRSRRKLEGTMPPAAPECTPSCRTLTVRSEISMPLSDVVIQSWS